MKAFSTLFTSLFFSFFLFQNCNSQPALVLTQITSASSPVDIAHAGDGSNRLFIVEKAGRIRIFDLNTNTMVAGNFLNIIDQVSDGGERGLLGLAFHPNYATNGYFYVNYTDNAGDTRISRFTVSPPSSNTVDTSTQFFILTIDQPYSNHNAGDLEFGPDGYLYIPMGDGGDGGDPGNRAQNPQQLLGKLLRINVNSTSAGKNYAIPPDNPFAGVQVPNDTLDEIWALGLRNPWRFSFDRLTHDIWIGDVGQGQWEEVNFQPASSTGGENYGWRCYEGNHPYNTSGCGTFSSYDAPVFEYPHSSATGGFSISGGYVYRGTNFTDMYGWYVVADYVSENFWLIRPDGVGGWDWQIQPDVPVTGNSTPIEAISSFGEDEDGELYAASLNGPIYSVAGFSNPCPVDSTLTLNPHHLDTVSASNSLTTQGAVTVPNNATVVFRAGEGITLAANFGTATGAELTAYIEDCSAGAMQQHPPVQASFMPSENLSEAISAFQSFQNLLRTGIFGLSPLILYLP